MPIVQTVHDLIILNTSVHNLNVSKFRRRLEAALFNSDLIISVSEYTKGEIVERYPQVADRIRVVYQPVPAENRVLRESDQPEIRQSVLAKWGLASQGYLFYVGAIEERKNIARLIWAYQRSRASREMPLVLAGALEESYLRREGVWDLFQPQARQSAGRVIYLGKVSELEKLCLLREAALFTFPSITEGFGIPLLEAQSMGCPVLTTNSSAIPEVVGDAAVLVRDPQDADEISAGIDSVVFNTELSRSLSAGGRSNSARFSKKNFARDVGRVLAEVMP